MPRVIETASKLVLLASFFLLSIESIVSAENLEAQKKALEAIADFADRICSTIPLKGDGKNLELTGNAKAELNEFLKRVANLGIEGAAKYQASEWQGVLQQDLAGQLNNSRSCKLEVYKDLKDKLFGQSQSSADRAKGAPQVNSAEFDSDTLAVSVYAASRQKDTIRVGLSIRNRTTERILLAMHFDSSTAVLIDEETGASMDCRDVVGLPRLNSSILEEGKWTPILPNKTVDVSLTFHSTEVKSRRFRLTLHLLRLKDKQVEQIAVPLGVTLKGS